MFTSCIAILIFFLAKILGERLPTEDKLTTILKSTERPENDPLASLPDGATEACRGDDCRPPLNLVGPIVGSLCGIILLALIAVFIIWFYLKRKYEKSKEGPMTIAIKYIEEPPLYTNAISTTDSTSRLYDISPSRRDSINSHYYEKINYNDRP